MIRCARCRLVQYCSSQNRCRRCFYSFAVEPPPPPEPVIVQEAHPNIAAGVRSWRQVRGLTQKQLATAAQLPRTYISRIENGRILPGLMTLERVAGALHIALPALLDRNGRKSNGNGHGHGNGNGNGNGHGNGYGSHAGSHVDVDGEEFMRQMLAYSSSLTQAQRAVVMLKVRQLAATRN